MFSFGKKKKRIYMDYASKTPVAKEVSSLMENFYGVEFSNPSSLHLEGRASKEVIEKSRKSIANILGSKESEIFFTSGGTESNNLVLFGIFESAKAEGIKNPHIIVSSIEHPAILEVCKKIESLGGEVTYLPVSPEGIVSPNELFESIKENTVLVSVMYANNEIGTIQPIKEISQKIKIWRDNKKSRFPYFHSDACQAALYLTLDVSKLGLDLMTLDGIKMYGPSGVGLLYKKSDVKISPVNYGGGQEGGLRSGTENVPGIVGFSKALEIAEKMKKNESDRLLKIRDYAIDEILKNFPNAVLNGSKENRLPNNINVCLLNIDSEFVVVALDVYGISASYSSACKTLSENSSSYVVSALGRENCSMSSLRFTLGRESQKSDIDFLISSLRKIVPLV